MEPQSNTTSLLAIRVEGETLAVNSIDFAKGLGIQHKNLLDTIRTHQQAIEQDFGLIAFETESVKREGERGRKHLVSANLTEDQALFIGTLSKNSKRVVEFKAVLVKSFAEARKRLQQTPPVALSNDQAIIQLLVQQTQILAETQRTISQLRTDVDTIMVGQRPAPARPASKTLAIGPPTAKAGKHTNPLRKLVNSKVNDYCAYHTAEPSETYNYLYKRLYDVYGVNVYRLIRAKGESILDAVERYGHLDRLYSLINAELAYVEE